jgi:hypothetical protein
MANAAVITSDPQVWVKLQGLIKVTNGKNQVAFKKVVDTFV